jgi:hypothetical protein
MKMASSVGDLQGGRAFLVGVVDVHVCPWLLSKPCRPPAATGAVVLSDVQSPQNPTSENPLFKLRASISDGSRAD